MIKSDKGKVEVKGTGSELLADLSVIITELKRIMKMTGISESKTTDIIQMSVNNGLMYEEPKEPAIPSNSEVAEILKSIIERVNRRV